MGAAVPVVGAVLGVAGAVSQHSAAQQQADAQRSALNQQSAIEAQNTKLRLIELQRQKLYSDFQGQIDTAKREIAKFTDENALNQAALMDTINRNTQQFGVQQQAIEAQTQNQQLVGQSQETRYGSQIQASGLIATEAEQGRQQLTDLANQGVSVLNAEAERKRAEATTMAGFANGDVAGLSLSDAANLMNMAMSGQDTSASYLQRYNQIVDQVRQGGLNAEAVANITRQMGANEADFLAGSAERGRQFIDLNQAYNEQEVQNNYQMNQLGIEAARAAQNTAYTIDSAQQALNTSFYDIQRQSQESAIKGAGQAVQAQIATQKGAITNPSIFGVLGAGFNAYQAASSAFSGGGGRAKSSSVPVANQPSYQPNGYGYISGFRQGGQ